MPTIWSRFYAWGMDAERPIDPQMPKSKGAKNQQNTLWALLADIRQAWDRAPLDLDERRMLVLCGGVGLNYTEAGYWLGVHKSTAMRRFERGIGVLVDYLNGTDTQAEPDED